MQEDPHLSQVDYRTNKQKPYRKYAWEEGPGTYRLRKLEYQKSRVRSKVEYVFHVIKGIIGFRKTHYKGLSKLKPTWTFSAPVPTFSCSARRGEPKESKIRKRLCSSTLNFRGNSAIFREMSIEIGRF